MKNLKGHHWIMIGGTVVIAYLLYNHFKTKPAVATTASNGANTTAFTGGIDVNSTRARE